MTQISRRTLLSLAATGTLSAVSGSLFAQSNAKGYETLPAPVALRESSVSSGKVEVLEFFWFGCPHCFAFEPSINAWKDSKPDYVNFVREAPPFNPSWVAHSQAFYASQVMDVTDDMFEPLFNAIHKEKMRLNDVESIAKFVATVGIDSDEYLKTMRSREVQVRMENSLELAKTASVRSVPAILINGKYMASNSISGGHEGIINAINTLIEQENKQG